VTFFHFGVAFLILVFAQMFTESPFGDSATPNVHALVIVAIQKALIETSFSIPTIGGCMLVICNI
jgi:hypothetical protein